jgi:hypothetical protein
VRPRFRFFGTRGDRRIASAVLLCSLFIAGSQIEGQEAIRMSLAAEAAAAARQKALVSNDSFNLRLGQTRWEFGGGLDFEGDDNIRFTERDQIFDLVTRPRVDAAMIGVVSEQNTIELSVRTGYSAYASHSEFNRFFVAPGSGFSFNLYAGDWLINFHDRVSITEDAFEDPTVVGSANYAQLQNAAGFTANCDLNKVLLTLGYDHGSYVRIFGSGGSPDGSSESLSLSAGYRVTPWARLGIESGGGFINYGPPAGSVRDACDRNLGTFVQIQPMEYITLQAGAGYTVYQPNLVGSSGDENQFRGVYARLGMVHRLNRFIDYTLNFSRTIDFGFYSGTIDMYLGAADARWHLFPKLSLVTGFEFEHGSQVLVGEDTFERFGPRLSLERPITARASASLRYQYYQRQSNVSGADYVVNVVTLSISYRL